MLQHEWSDAKRKMWALEQGAEQEWGALRKEASKDWRRMEAAGEKEARGGGGGACRLRTATARRLGALVGRTRGGGTCMPVFLARLLTQRLPTARLSPRVGPRRLPPTCSMIGWWLWRWW